MERTAVILMAYGSPERPADVPAYLAHVLGREPDPASIEDLRRRYEAIGGRSPLLEETRKQADALERELRRLGAEVTVSVGMKHWHPFVGDVVRELAATGVEWLVGIVAAPHYASMSIGGYERAVDAALHGAANGNRPPPAFRMVRDWHREPAFVRCWTELLKGELQTAHAPGDEEPTLLFTAHSLPAGPIEAGDPYRAQFQESGSSIAGALGGIRHAFGWQSGGDRPGWLRPTVEERLGELARAGTRSVVAAPIGFTCEHLEILYDLDIAARAAATKLGIRLSRPPMPGADPALVEAMAGAVIRQSTTTR